MAFSNYIGTQQVVLRMFIVWVPYDFNSVWVRSCKQVDLVYNFILLFNVSCKWKISLGPKSLIISLKLCSICVLTLDITRLCRSATPQWAPWDAHRFEVSNRNGQYRWKHSHLRLAQKCLGWPPAANLGDSTLAAGKEKVQFDRHDDIGLVDGKSYNVIRLIKLE